MVYLGENDYDVSHAIDSILYSHAISSVYSDKWLEAMNYEMKSMAHNDVWELVIP